MTDSLMILSTMAVITIMFSSIIVEINKEKVIEETKVSLKEFKKMRSKLIAEISTIESKISESEKQDLGYIDIDSHEISSLFSKKMKMRKVEQYICECEEILSRIS